MRNIMGQFVIILSGLNGAELAKERASLFQKALRTLYVMNTQTGRETSVTIQEGTLVNDLMN